MVKVMLIAIQSGALTLFLKKFFVLAATQCSACHEVFYVVQSRDIPSIILHGPLVQELKKQLAREHSANTRHEARYDFVDGESAVKYA